MSLFQFRFSKKIIPHLEEMFAPIFSNLCILTWEDVEMSYDKHDHCDCEGDSTCSWHSRVKDQH